MSLMQEDHHSGGSGGGGGANEIDLQPTQAMADEAARGLEWRQEFGRGGTRVGVARARDLRARRNLSPSTVRRMVSYFARHEVDKQAEGFRRGEAGYPSAGRIAWALWGGDPGQVWANAKADELNAIEDEAEVDDMGQALARHLEPLIDDYTNQREITFEQLAQEISNRVEFEMGFDVETSEVASVLRGDEQCPARYLLYWIAEILDGDKEEMVSILIGEDECEYEPLTLGDDEDEDEPSIQEPETPNEESSPPKAKEYFIEKSDGKFLKTESLKGGGRKIWAIALTANLVNRNNRLYETAVIEDAISRLKESMKEASFQGRAILLGEAEHPSDKGQTPHILETIVRWDSIEFDGTHVLLEGTIIPTEEGLKLGTIMDYGVFPGISQRAWGQAETIEVEGRPVERITYLSHIEAYDLVMRPSDLNGAITVIESMNNGDENVKVKDKKLQESGNNTDGTAPATNQSLADILANVTATDIRAANPDLANTITNMQLHDESERQRQEEERKAADQARLDAHARQQNAGIREELGLTETADLASEIKKQQEELDRLRRADAKREVIAYAESEIANSSYDTDIKESFQKEILEDIETLGITRVDEAKGLISKLRRRFDEVQSKFDVRAQGYGIKVMGPVFEKETGMPAYAAGSHMISESLRPRSEFSGWDYRKPKNAPERLAKMMLDLFDEKFGDALMREAKSMDEATTFDDLKLPVSVARTVVAEVFPTLVGAQCFDTGIAEGGKFVEILYEKTVWEDGAVVTVAPFAMVSDATQTINGGTWLELPHAGISPGTVTVEVTATADASFTGTLVPYQDYTLDYVTGRLWINYDGPSALTAAAAPMELLVGYDYNTFACSGCDTSIPQMNMEMCTEVVEVCAHALATCICNDAIVFSQKSLNYDLVNRQLSNLVRKIREYIDQSMFWTALGSALRLGPSNIVGTWDSSSDTVESLVRLIGLAKVALTQRNYDATCVITTPMIGDILSNWDPSCCNRPDMLLGSDGMLGRIKGLDLVVTNNFNNTDSWIMVVNRDHVHYRVCEPLTIDGPFPTYKTDLATGNSHVINAREWTATEYSAVAAPLAEKATLIQII